MKIKNLNPLELHIEKIVLAVAVLGAGYLAYACWSNPTMINRDGRIDAEKKDLEPEKVEGEIRDQLTLFKNRQNKTNELVKQGSANPANGLTANVDVKAYKAKLEEASKGQLASFDPKQFAPVQIAAGATVDGNTPMPQKDLIKSLVTPQIVGNVNAEVFQGVVGYVQQGVLLNQWDANVVKLSAQFPMGKLRDALRGYPQAFQVVLVTNAEWERCERMANGQWSEYKPVPALAGPPSTTSGPAIVATAPAPFPLAEVVTKFKSIELGMAPNKAQDWLRQIKANTEANLQHKLPAGFDRAPNAKPMFSDAAAGVKAPDRTPADDVYGGTVGEIIAPANPGGGAPAPAPIAVPAGGIGNFAALTTKEVVELVNYDDTMQSGREYKYRVRVSIYNPLYGWPKQLVNRLEDKSMADVPFMATAWVEVGAPVKVEPTEYFFVTNAGGLGGAGKPNTVRVELFKRKLGVWYKAIQDEVPVGAQIGVGALSLINKNPGGVTDFATKFSVVDVTTTNGKISGVVLTDVLGDLVARSVIDDATSAKYKELEQNHAKAGPPAAGGATPGGPAAVGN